MNKIAYKYWLYRLARQQSVAITCLIAKTYGDQIGFVYVAGYPKSGTTWLSQLVGHYLYLPFPDGYFSPIAFKAIIHHHWQYDPAFDHSFYVIRDGRDVMVSLYAFIMKTYSAIHCHNSWGGPLPWLVRAIGDRARIDKRLHQLFGRNFDPNDFRKNLPRFIDSEMQSPILPAVNENWPDHVTEWLEKGKRTVFVKYEQMLANAVGCFIAAMACYEPSMNTDAGLGQSAVEHYSFTRRSGRRRGEEDRSSFLRKGIKGDWKNYFSLEARQIFDHYAGDLLIELGYERNRGWIEQDIS